MNRLTTPELIEVMKKPMADYCKLCGAALTHDRNCPERSYINPQVIAHYKPEVKS